VDGLSGGIVHVLEQYHDDNEQEHFDSFDHVGGNGVGFFDFLDGFFVGQVFPTPIGSGEKGEVIDEFSQGHVAESIEKFFE
jgi:hypothetical protein